MQTNEKQIQIPLETFLELYMLLNGFYDSEIPESKNKRLESVKSVLNDKMKKLAERQHYTKSKTAPTDAERQLAIEKYLEMRND